MPHQKTNNMTSTPLVVLSQTIVGFGYRGNISVSEVLTAWGIRTSSKGDKTGYVRLESVHPLWNFVSGGYCAFYLKDEYSRVRLLFLKSPLSDRLYTNIRSPVDVCTTGDGSMIWVEVTLHGKVIFKTMKIKDYEPDDYDDGSQYVHAVLFQEAIEYVREHYPLVFSDPLAYW